MDNIEKSLTDNQWIGGQAPTAADREAYEETKACPPCVATHPHAFAWWCLVSKFTEAVRATWGGAAPAKKAAAPKAEAPKAEAPKAEAKKDDDFDPFADDAEEDAGEAAANLKAKAEAAKKASEKKAPVAKSIIVWEVKPWGEETDLDELAKAILAIEMEGLFWKTQYKKEPIAYGLFKLVIGATIHDALVSTDDVQEKIEAMEELVQSVDIQSFNKI